ncbi:MAG: hypothetical protein SRB2_02854 [Desulfobacteraceae bacterium Eth-SRB2]|nr:MAG: hypothetical protein SRB2_02854 [Desulfobacteraceae bacterium Eth-SRB2]
MGDFMFPNSPQCLIGNRSRKTGNPIRLPGPKNYCGESAEPDVITSDQGKIGLWIDLIDIDLAGSPVQIPR